MKRSIFFVLALVATLGQGCFSPAPTPANPPAQPAPTAPPNVPAPTPVQPKAY